MHLVLNIFSLFGEVVLTHDEYCRVFLQFSNKQISLFRLLISQKSQSSSSALLKLRPYDAIEVRL